MKKLAIILVVLFLSTFSFSQTRWFKGNLHTHSFWSDGDDFPESIIHWYKQNEYDFIAISDHNTLAEGEKWIEINSSKAEALKKYYCLFDSSWIETKTDSSKLLVRLKTYNEYTPLFEEPGSFLIIKSEEITDRFKNKPIHVNATNIVELISPQGGSSVAEVLQNNIDAVIEQRKKTGQDMFPHINHPNFGWAVTAEDLIKLEGDKFFEVYNGHPLVNNFGDSLHPSTERIWDIVLTKKLSKRDYILYGIASDDAHHYHTFETRKSNPGRGWIMVNTEEMTASSIISAMEQGKFYATSGVEINEIKIENDKIKIEIIPEDGVTYKTYFIGTKKNYDKNVDVIYDKEGIPIRKIYSNEIGEVLAEKIGVNPEYIFNGDEIYVRAKIVSSRLKVNPYKKGEMETAWIQPVVR